MDGTAICVLFLALLVIAIALWARVAQALPGTRPARVVRPPVGWHLVLGHATGTLRARGHANAAPASAPLSLSATDAAQNIVVLGAIGTGKTTAMMQPLLDQLLAQASGGLVFDIKGDFGDVVRTLAQRHAGSHVRLIGPGHSRFNVLAGLSPEMAASFLKSAILLSGYGSGDGFWVDSATELLRNTFGVLNVVPGRYSLEGAYSYLFNPEEREHLDSEILAAAPRLAGHDLRRLRAYQGYHESVFAGFDEKVAAGIRATVAQVLSPFSHPELVEAFCLDDLEPLAMEQVLRPTVLLVDLPLARWGLGAKVVYTLIKLRFFNLMQQRSAHRAEDSGAPVFFMCDEYQEVVSANKDGLSDLNFWDKSRSSGTVGIVSAQSVASFYAAVGQRDLADAILQNFRQKVCFRTEDLHTVRLITALLGQADQEQESESQGRSGKLGSGTQYTRGSQYAVIQREVVGAQQIRQLDRFEAIATLSLEGRACDDVMVTAPLYL